MFIKCIDKVRFSLYYFFMDKKKKWFNVEELRLSIYEKGLDVTTFADEFTKKEIKLSRNTVHQWLNGTNQPRKKTFRRFEHFFGKPLKKFMK